MKERFWTLPKELTAEAWGFMADQDAAECDIIVNENPELFTKWATRRHNEEPWDAE